MTLTSIWSPDNGTVFEGHGTLRRWSPAGGSGSSGTLWCWCAVTSQLPASAMISLQWWTTFLRKANKINLPYNAVRCLVTVVRGETSAPNCSLAAWPNFSCAFHLLWFVGSSRPLSAWIHIASLGVSDSGCIGANLAHCPLPMFVPKVCSHSSSFPSCSWLIARHKGAGKSLWKQTDGPQTPKHLAYRAFQIWHR